VAAVLLRQTSPAKHQTGLILFFLPLPQLGVAVVDQNPIQILGRKMVGMAALVEVAELLLGRQMRD
jgi:hypothetical protein